MNLNFSESTLALALLTKLIQLCLRVHSPEDIFPHGFSDPGVFYGLYSPWGGKELDTTERLSLHITSQILTAHISKVIESLMVKPSRTLGGGGGSGYKSLSVSPVFWLAENRLCSVSMTF